jgi:hypothetical protein
MNFAELKEIIRHLKKVVPCTTCQKKFLDEDMRVLFTIGNDALFHLSCHNCKNQLIVRITITEQTTEKSQINIHTQQASEISHNDILDIHNFLNSFNGDFEKLFSEIN